MKKVLSLVLALTMVLALAVPAFAGSTEPEWNVTDSSKLGTGITTRITGQTAVGTVKVFVPTTGTVILNPYGLKLKYNATDGTTDVADDGKTDQIISPVQYIENGGTSDLIVYANVSGEAAGDAKLVETDPTNETTKAVQLNLAMKTLDTKADTDKVSDVTAATDGSQNLTAVKARGENTAMVILKANAANAKKYAAFGLTGKTSTKATTNWTDKDKVTVSVVFTFVPGSNMPTATP